MWVSAGGVDHSRSPSLPRPRRLLPDRVRCSIECAPYTINVTKLRHSVAYVFSSGSVVLLLECSISGVYPLWLLPHRTCIGMFLRMIDVEAHAAHFRCPQYPCLCSAALLLCVAERTSSPFFLLPFRAFRFSRAVRFVCGARNAHRPPSCHSMQQ